MPKDPALSEAQLVERLRPRYQGESGNGPAGCVIAQVRNQAGFDASRTIDALGFHFWPSRGLLVDAFECKSSRSDWVREIENPAKADTFCAVWVHSEVHGHPVPLHDVDDVRWFELDIERSEPMVEVALS